MVTSHNPQNVIERIQSKDWNNSDIESLRQLLFNNDKETLQQLAKYNVNITEGKDIHIGDRTYYSWDEKAIKAVVEVVQKGAVAIFNPTGKVTIYNYYNYYREETTAVFTDATEETDDLPCPYRGLFSFGPEDAKYFFGREKFIEELYRATQTRNFIPVLGASASGKSSVVFAGLVPKLQQEGYWQFTYFRPGTIRKRDKQEIPDPFFALATALVPLYAPELNKTQQFKQANDLADWLRSGKVLLSDVIGDIQKNYPNYRLLLIADQFEEIYTICEEEKIRRQFLDILIDNIYTPTSNSFLVLVLTMRADFLGNALSYHSFAEVLGTDMKLGEMNHTQLGQAIEKPGANLGVKFQEGLVESILDDLEDEPGNLALLEFALTELWKRRKGKQITHAAYQEIGQVRGALTRHADSVFLKLSAEEKQQARRIFIQLVNLGEGTGDTRRRVAKSELGESNWKFVTKLAGKDYRLVVTSQDGNQQETVEVVHEALIRNWSQLRNWVSESRDAIATGRKIEEKAKEWKDMGRNKGYLLQGRQLRDAKEFQKEKAEQFTLSSLAEELIKASVKSRWNNRLKLTSFLAIPIAVLFAIVEPMIRILRIERAYEAIKSGSFAQKSTAVKYLTRGCKFSFEQGSLIPLLFGNCEPLQKTNLSELALEGVNLRGAYLRNADFQEALLREGDLRDANLQLVNFEGANLFRADLRGAELLGANFHYATLVKAKLEGTDLRDVNFINANLSEANLTKANLAGNNLELTDFRDANLREANLSEADLSDADFRGSNLSGANLERSGFWQASRFGGSNLRDAKLIGAILIGADLWQADLSNANLKGADFSEETDLSEANLKGADFREDEGYGKVTGLTPKQVKSACYWQEAKFDAEFLEKLNSEPEQSPDCSAWEDESY